MKKKSDNVKQFAGQGLVEYALIIAIIAIVVMIAVSAFGGKAQQSYEDILNALGGTMPPLNNVTTYCSSDMGGLGDWDLQGNQTNNWITENGQICMKNTGGSNYAYNQCSKSSLPENSDYVVHMKVATLLEGNGYGVMFRMQNYTNSPSGYGFQYDPGLKAFVFRKWVNGAESVISSYKPGNDYQWHNVSRDVKVVVSGTSMKAYIDDELVLTAEDSKYSTGGVGLRTWYGSSACFDDFEITSIPSEAE